MTLFELFEVQRSNQVFLKGRPLALKKGISSTTIKKILKTAVNPEKTDMLSPGSARHGFSILLT